MIHIIHNGAKLLKVTLESEEITVPLNGDIVTQFTKIASLYPEENIIWLKEDTVKNVDIDEMISKFKAGYYMLSFGNINDHFLYPKIGYVTDGPFTTVSQENIFPSWLMQDTAGMVAASTINQFKASDYKNQSLEYFLTSIARIGQSQGLFCYHIPVKFNVLINSDGSNDALFKFVGQHYKKVWTFLLLFLLHRYEKISPFFSFAKGLFSPSLSTELLLEQKNYNTSTIAINYDVIIPTMGRKNYLKDVLLDINQQEFLPQKVIVIEQNGDVQSSTQLDYISSQKWSFKIEHYFIHQTGACNARNVALQKATASWVLLFDDDLRVKKDFSKLIVQALENTNAKAMTFSCLQENEIEKGNFFKQWESFGSGCSIIHREIVEKCKFDMALEHGYGEDVDYGMQIRNAGYDVIYAPQIQLLHLKAPVGGFRKPHVFPWEGDVVLPKPSPQIMYHRTKNSTLQQLRGFKVTLFIKFYKDYSIKNPIAYYKYFKRAWSKSLYWSQKLVENATV